MFCYAYFIMGLRFPARSLPQRLYGMIDFKTNATSLIINYLQNKKCFFYGVADAFVITIVYPFGPLRTLPVRRKELF